MPNLELIKQLREETAAGIVDVKNALEEAGNDAIKAAKILRQKGFDKAESREGHEVKAGLVDSYIHATGRIGALVVVACETDFVSRLTEFKELAHNVAMQVAAMNPETVDELLEQPFIKDSTKTVKDLVTEVIAKTRENIKILEFKRFQI